MKQKRIIGIIGGSGFYNIPNLVDVKFECIHGPWGEASDKILRGRINNVEFAFIARHGSGHRLPPGEINYRANIDAMKRVGVTDLISISACGSLNECMAPGDFVIVDQFIDRTTQREKSFFGGGFVAHVSMADPVCRELCGALERGCVKCNIPYHRGGTYIAIDGPQFSSRAESKLYRRWGCDVIGMTNMPEAKLAREAELPYATVAMVSDYDCWRPHDEAVEVENVLTTIAKNTQNAVRLIPELVKELGPDRSNSEQRIETTLDRAVITSRDSRNPELCEKLDAVAGRFLQSQVGP